MKNLPILETGTAFELSLDKEAEKLSAQEFDTLILDAVDSTLSMLGDSSKQAFYHHLEKNFSIRRETIPANIDKFTYALEKIFGRAALLLETRIMQGLHSKVQLFKYIPGKEDLSFAGYLQGLRDFL